MHLDKITVGEEVYDTLIDGHNDDEFHESVHSEDAARSETAECHQMMLSRLRSALSLLTN